MNIPDITDNQIIELADIYALDPVNYRKDLLAYLRDAAYYGYGYILYRKLGYSHEVAAQFFRQASSVDGYYINVPDGMLPDNTIIEINERFVSRYDIIGRLKRQTNNENARDLIYWLIVYAKGLEHRLSHELSIQQMENGMAIEANMQLPYPIIKTPINEITEPWTIDGKIFRYKGEPITHKGFSAFNLADQLIKGIDKTSFLSEFKGYNLARIFLYVNPSDWKSDAWFIPKSDDLISAIKYLGSQGLMVRLTCCTDGDESKVNAIKDTINALRDAHLVNLQLEAVNEPYIEFNGPLYGKLNPDVFKNVIINSGYIYSSGIYASNNRFWGKIWLDHSPRDAEWYRKGGHNLYEAYNGGGPSDGSEPALKILGIEDEPIRPDQADYDSVSAYAYAASTKLFGAGATCHTTCGKLTSNPTDKEKDWIAAFLHGLDIFPVDACNGMYRRIVEKDQPVSGRTYVVGRYSIRIGQNGTGHPEGGWKPLDDYGICWEW